MEPSHAVRTLVLLGRTGNGKSATGNSILRKKAFKSTFSSIGVTRTSQLETAELEDGTRLNVIDTPGLIDASADSSFIISKEIVKCIQMAEGGIHAFLVVLSVRNRFSYEEENAFHNLKELFGDKVVDYAIIVFTNGDELEESDETLDDYLDRNSTGPLKEVLQMCGNRCVLFDNRTRDESKKNEQLRQLLCLVNKVVDKNDGQPYKNDLFVQFKPTPNLHLPNLKNLPRHGGVENDRNCAQVKLKPKETTGRLDQQFDDFRRESKNKTWELNEKIEDQRESKNKTWKLNENIEDQRESKNKIREWEDRRESKNKIRELNEKIEDRKEKTPRHGGGVEDDHSHAQVKLKLKVTTRRPGQQLDDAREESENNILELNERIENLKEKTPCNNCSIV